MCVVVFFSTLSLQHKIEHIELNEETNEKKCDTELAFTVKR